MITAPSPRPLAQQVVDDDGAVGRASRLASPPGGDPAELGAGLRQALANDELMLFYQPLVDLQSGAVASLEALVRWRHPVHGLLAAREFLALADAAGLTGAIDEWVLRRACRDLRAWRAAGMAELKVAINIAPGRFRDPTVGAAVAAMLADCAIAPGMLTLEVTESALTLAGADCDALLDGYTAAGLSLTLDDFGTGHAALSNLKRHPFDALKIDAHFIRDVVAGGQDAAMCKTLIAMAHHLGMKVVAEGVETEAQCDFLRRNMCDLIQGYFFSPPLAPDELGHLLASGRALAPHLRRLHKPARRLLLVDDEPNIVAALKRLLRADHYDIYSANDGQQGLDLLATQQVDVIISDQRMPGMLGADFLRKAKQQYPDTIRIMLSGYTELQSVTDAVNEGAIYKFLTKPWDDELLRGHVAEAFRLKEIADDNERLHLAVRSANLELAAANRQLEQLLLEKQRQISRDEVSLHVAREVLQHLPLPVIGMDDAGMIAFINGAAEGLFRHSGALLGNEAGSVLPQLFAAPAADAGAALDAGDGNGGEHNRRDDGNHGNAGAEPARHASPTRHLADIDGRRYAVVVYPMGESSASRGSLITLSLTGDAA